MVSEAADLGDEVFHGSGSIFVSGINCSRRAQLSSSSLR
jgi:hypothetical protein